MEVRVHGRYELEEGVIAVDTGAVGVLASLGGAVCQVFSGVVPARAGNIEAEGSSSLTQSRGQCEKTKYHGGAGHFAGYSQRFMVGRSMKKNIPILKNIEES